MRNTLCLMAWALVGVVALWLLGEDEDWDAACKPTVPDGEPVDQGEDAHWAGQRMVTPDDVIADAEKRRN